MATWKGNPKNFTMEVYDPKDGYYSSSYEPVEFGWDYNTTSDTLKIRVKNPFQESTELFGKDHAEALLYTLADWYNAYEGKDAFKNLIKDILEKE